jgi:hypothetical protein
LLVEALLVGFGCLTLHWPGLALAGDLLSLLYDKKEGKEITLLAALLLVPSGDAGRGSQTPCGLRHWKPFSGPVITSSRRARGERKGR